MIKPHIKVIQRNGVDIFITSSVKDKVVKSGVLSKGGLPWDGNNSQAVALQGVGLFQTHRQIGLAMGQAYTPLGQRGLDGGRFFRSQLNSYR